MLEFAFLSWDEINTDYIEADWRRGRLRKLTDIAAGEAAEDVALVVVDGGLGGCEVASGAGFYFDEAEHRSIPGDQVYVTGHVSGGPAARDDGVAFALQVEQRGVFAVDGALLERFIIASVP